MMTIDERKATLMREMAEWIRDRVEMKPYYATEGAMLVARYNELIALEQSLA